MMAWLTMTGPVASWRPVLAMGDIVANDWTDPGPAGDHPVWAAAAGRESSFLVMVKRST